MNVADAIVAAVEQHPSGTRDRGRSYYCMGCSERFVEEQERRFRERDVEPSLEELKQFRREHTALNNPGWTLRDYGLHLASAALQTIEP